MHKGIEKNSKSVARDLPAAKPVAGRDKTFWLRLFGKGNSPLPKFVEAPDPIIARLNEGDMKAILRCIEDNSIWRKVGDTAIDRKLISSLGPEDARDVFVCIAKHRSYSDKFRYFTEGQIKPEIFSEQDVLALVNTVKDQDAVLRYMWLLEKEGIARMKYEVRRAALFKLMKEWKLRKLKCFANAEWERFGQLSAEEKEAIKSSIFASGCEDRDLFFTRERLLLFNAEDRRGIIGQMVARKQNDGLDIARSFYSEKEGREELFSAIVEGRIYCEGHAGNANREAKAVIAGIFGGMFTFPAAVLAALSIALDMPFGKLMNEGGEMVAFFGAFIGAGLGLFASFGIEGMLTRFKVKRSERKAMREAVKNAEELELLRKMREENVV